jgi:transposase
MSMSLDVSTNLRVGRRNRSWPDALKREIVAASFEPGASVSVVARRYDVNTNQLFAWRKLYRESGPCAGGVRLLPVTVTREPAVAAKPSGEGVIEIELADKYRLRVGADVDAMALRRVLDALERR